MLTYTLTDSGLFPGIALSAGDRPRVDLSRSKERPGMSVFFADARVAVELDQAGRPVVLRGSIARGYGHGWFVPEREGDQERALLLIILSPECFVQNDGSAPENARILKVVGDSHLTHGARGLFILESGARIRLVRPVRFYVKPILRLEWDGTDFAQSEEVDPSDPEGTRDLIYF